ncbi:BnaA05g33160D [Brassica napus]|uniref:BnaA05g33160D protein n=2 Tax=Brassica napus TaxID=3708 RepID=A0A078IIX6_BRANA|nr:BnaA05g33160D [Brassica napus]
MLKHCIEVSASQIMLFRSPESSGVLKDLDDAKFVGKALDTSLVISVSPIRYAQPLTRYQRLLGVMTAKDDEERKGRPNYRPIIDHDGLPRQRLSNQDMNKMKTREELLAEERDYKRRRMSYRGNKVKGTPRQVLSGMIEEFTEEVKIAGGIGCFEKGMPLHSSSSISKGQKESDLGYSSALAQRDNRVTDHKSAVIAEMMNSQGPNDVGSSREKSSSDYKTKRDDRYDRSSWEPTKTKRDDRYDRSSREPSKTKMNLARLKWIVSIFKQKFTRTRSISSFVCFPLHNQKPPEARTQTLEIPAPQLLSLTFL